MFRRARERDRERERGKRVYTTNGTRLMHRVSWLGKVSVCLEERERDRQTDRETDSRDVKEYIQQMALS